MRVRQSFSLIMLVSMLVACATSVDHLPVTTGTTGQTASQTQQVSVQYLGVGGLLIRYGDTALLTAPSFSNPALLGLPPGPFQPIAPDDERIDALMPPVDDVEMILVGHAHYDHLMDVPRVMEKHALKAHVYGSQTMKHSIAGSVSEERIVVVNDRAARGDSAGDWFYAPSGKLRIMAIESEHAPHVMGITFMQGRYEQDLPDLPWHSFGWKEGKTFAYLIDFLDDKGKPVYRVHYQDAASTPPLGFVPELAMNDQRRVDLAFHCVGAFEQVENYPEGLVTDLQPKVSILGHWEDFFGNDPTGDQEGIRLTSIDNFIRRLETVQADDANWYLPDTFAVMHFPVSQ